MLIEKPNLLEISDDLVLQSAAQGDQEAFGVLYQRYVDRIYNYVFYRTGNQHDAEDLTARVFLRAMRHIKKYQNRGIPFSAWLYRIAHNLVANWHRDNSRRQNISLEEVYVIQNETLQPETMLLRNEEQETLLQVIRLLPPARQQLLILKFAEQLSNAEIGKIMGKTEGAVKSLYHRTLISLREELSRTSTPNNNGKNSHLQ